MVRALHVLAAEGKIGRIMGEAGSLWRKSLIALGLADLLEQCLRFLRNLLDPPFWVLGF